MTKPPAAERARFWKRHFEDRHARRAAEGLARSLDYSNERVLLQTYAHLLEGVGAVAGKSFLDAGCGWGALALALHACGARVTAIDVVAATVEQLQRLHPAIAWKVADLTDAGEVGALGPFDGIVAAEVLQYLDFGATAETLWSRLAPGGRFLGAVPNGECPIARRVIAQQGGRWCPVSAAEIRRTARELPGLASVHLKGLTFRRDQTLLPYRASDWGEEIEGTPNRILFLMIKEP